MPKNRFGRVGLVLFLVTAPAAAGGLDTLQGKFAFNLNAEPGGQKCVKVDGKLLADFKTAKYRCDLNARSNTSTGASARTCTGAKDGKEYLIFDTLKACEEERKTQASNE